MPPSRSTSARRYPLSYVYAGMYEWSNGILHNQDSYGVWWSTTAYSASNAYYMDMHSSDLNPQTNYTKLTGFALRSTSARRYPLSYVYSGMYEWSNGILYNQDFYGVWWSTSAYNTNNAYRLYIPNSNLDPMGNDSKARGFALRSIKARRYPLSYVLSGEYLWDNGALASQNSYGTWWSAATSDSNNAYRTYIGKSDLVSQNIFDKLRGMTLRSTSARRYPLSYVYAGGYYWNTGSAGNQSLEGYYWASTANGSDKAYRLRIVNGDMDPQNNFLTRDGGLSLRFLPIILILY
ncbi:hypothetical protein IK112_02355 [Candidatus Saccharibacteria bacterium]|nr:hypothetical protein [Candidatus Saccharibacteria bacterium]